MISVSMRRTRKVWCTSYPLAARSWARRASGLQGAADSIKSAEPPYILDDRSSRKPLALGEVTVSLKKKEQRKDEYVTAGSASTRCTLERADGPGDGAAG
jgi:hypothetical protein